MRQVLHPASTRNIHARRFLFPAALLLAAMQVPATGQAVQPALQACAAGQEASGATYELTAQRGKNDRVAARAKVQTRLCIGDKERIESADAVAKNIRLDDRVRSAGPFQESIEISSSQREAVITVSRRYRLKRKSADCFAEPSITVTTTVSPGKGAESEAVAQTGHFETPKGKRC